MIDIVLINAEQPVIHVSGILAGAPGIVVQNCQSYVQRQQISSSRFSTRSAFGLRGVRLPADGIHASMPRRLGVGGYLQYRSSSHLARD